MVRELDRDCHVLEHAHSATAKVIRIPACDVIEVSGLINGDHAIGSHGLTQQVKLNLRVNHDPEAGVGCALHGALENPSGIRGSRATIGHEDVAEHAGHRVLVGTPREQLERRGIGLQQHIRLVDARQAFDG